MLTNYYLMQLEQQLQQSETASALVELGNALLELAEYQPEQSVSLQMRANTAFMRASELDPNIIIPARPSCHAGTYHNSIV